MGNIRTFFRTGSKKSKASPSTELQPAPPTQDVEAISDLPETSTPAPSQPCEPIDVSGLAEASLEECLPLYFGPIYPRQHEHNVWLDEHDREYFILQALVVISGKGTFRIDDKRIELRYLSQSDQWHAQLAVMERESVFGRPLKSDSPRPSKREAFIRLKHGIRKTFETLWDNNSLGCVPGILGERLQKMREYGKARHFLEHYRAPIERLENSDSMPPSRSAVSLPIHSRPRTILRSVTEPRRWGRFETPDRFEALLPGSDLYGPQTLMSAAKLIRTQKSAPDYLETKWKTPVRIHAPRTETTSYEEHTAGRHKMPSLKAQGKRPINDDESYLGTTEYSAEQLQQMIRAQSELAPLPSPEPEREGTGYDLILRKQQALALSMDDYEGAGKLSLQIKEVHQWRKHPYELHQRKPEGLVDSIPPPSLKQCKRYVRFQEPMESGPLPLLHSPSLRTGERRGTTFSDLNNLRMSGGSSRTAERMMLQTTNTNEQTFISDLDHDVQAHATTAQEVKAGIGHKDSPYMQQQPRPSVQRRRQSVQQPHYFTQQPQHFIQPQPQITQPLQFIQQPQVIIQYPAQYIPQLQPQVILQPRQFVQQPQQLIYQPQPVYQWDSRRQTAKHAYTPKEKVEERTRPKPGQPGTNQSLRPEHDSRSINQKASMARYH